MSDTEMGAQNWFKRRSEALQKYESTVLIAKEKYQKSQNELNIALRCELDEAYAEYIKSIQGERHV